MRKGEILCRALYISIDPITRSFHLTALIIRTVQCSSVSIFSILCLFCLYWLWFCFSKSLVSQISIFSQDFIHIWGIHFQSSFNPRAPCSKLVNPIIIPGFYTSVVVMISHYLTLCVPCSKLFNPIIIQVASGLRRGGPGNIWQTGMNIWYGYLHIFTSLINFYLSLQVIFHMYKCGKGELMQSLENLRKIIV